MKTNSEKNRSKTSYRKWFILLPVVFLLCGYLLLFASLAPILDPLLSVYRLAFANANVQTIDEPGAGSVFNGTTGLTQGVLNWDDFEFPAYGEAFGRITVEGTDIDTDVIYGDSTAAFDIRSGRVLDGELPARAAAMVREWIGLHRDDLVTMWETQEFKRIDPLD